MPNAQIATWGGDLGSTVAMKILNESDKGEPWKDWDEYLFNENTRASEADFNGDIDAHAIGRYLSGSTCSSVSKMAITSIKVPISQILYEYYVDDKTALARFRAERISCFLKGIGADLSASGKTIVGNRIKLVESVAIGLMSFVRAYYLVQRYLYYSNPLFWSVPAGTGSWIRAYSEGAARRFIHWLEGQL
jgi:hypothetical protein